MLNCVRVRVNVCHACGFSAVWGYFSHFLLYFFSPAISLYFVGGLYLFSMADCLFYGLFNDCLPWSTLRDHVCDCTKFLGSLYLVCPASWESFLPQLAWQSTRTSSENNTADGKARRALLNGTRASFLVKTDRIWLNWIYMRICWRFEYERYLKRAITISLNGVWKYL